MKVKMEVFILVSPAHWRLFFTHFLIKYDGGNLKETTYKKKSITRHYVNGTERGLTHDTENVLP